MTMEQFPDDIAKAADNCVQGLPASDQWRKLLRNRIAVSLADDRKSFRPSHISTEDVVSAKPLYTAAALRNLFGALNFIERSELETAAGTPLSNDAWEDFPASLPGMFKKLNDDRQEAVAALISSKIGG
jgi:hypothetical protein